MMRKRNVSISREETTAVIEKFSHDARGIARIDGKTTFIQGALAGETVTFHYTQKKKSYDEGRLHSVLNPSLDRVDPPCAHYALCGGCSLQHLNPSAQLQVKQEQLLDLLARVGRTVPRQVLSPLTVNHGHYRSKARFSVRFIEKHQKVVVGFRERNNPSYITSMTECWIIDARVNRLIEPLRDLIESLDARQFIAQVEVAVGDEEVAFIFRHLHPLDLPDEARLTAFGRMHAVRLYLQGGGPQTVRLFYPEDVDEYLTYSLPDHHVVFQFHPNDFTQVNPALNQKMVNQALTLLNLTPQDVVLDLFCGLGNFSLPMARYCSQVIGVEGHEAMVLRAERNATRNGLSNTLFRCVNLEQEAEFASLQGYKANKLLIDPPRAGAFALVNHMHYLNPEQILYVSCDPATLARDTAVLVHEKGYQLMAAGVMDMFPHTAHVEAMALFQK